MTKTWEVAAGVGITVEAETKEKAREKAFSDLNGIDVYAVEIENVDGPFEK